MSLLCECTETQACAECQRISKIHRLEAKVWADLLELVQVLQLRLPANIGRLVQDEALRALEEETNG